MDLKRIIHRGLPGGVALTMCMLVPRSNLSAGDVQVETLTYQRVYSGEVSAEPVRHRRYDYGYGYHPRFYRFGYRPRYYGFSNSFGYGSPYLYGYYRPRYYGYSFYRPRFYGYSFYRPFYRWYYYAPRFRYGFYSPYSSYRYWGPSYYGSYGYGSAFYCN